MSAKRMLIILLVSLAVGLYWPAGVARSQGYYSYDTCYGSSYYPYYSYCDYDYGVGVPFGYWGFDFDHGDRDFDRGEHHFHGDRHREFHGWGHGHH